MGDKSNDTEKKLKEMAAKVTNPKIKESIETKLSQLGKEVKK